MPDVHERTHRSVRSILRPAVKPIVVAGMRAAFRVVDPVTVGWQAARLASQPEQAAAEIARRVSSLVPPTPADVVGNYARGYVLFGRDAGPGEPDGFEWCSYALGPLRVIHMIIYFKLIKAWPAVMRRGRPDDHGRE